MYILKVPENLDGAFREIQDGRQDGHLIPGQLEHHLGLEKRKCSSILSGSSLDGLTDHKTS